MKFEYTYEDGNNCRWILVVNGQTIQIFCNGESRIYALPDTDTITDVKTNNEYVLIYVKGGNYYQFKFEINNFLVGDIFDENDDHIEEFASFVFGEE